MTWISYLKDSPIISLTIIAFIISVIGFFPLLGIPGALIYTKWQYISEFLGCKWLFPELTGDKAWPSYLLISITWTFCLPIGGLLGKHLFKLDLHSSSLYTYVFVTYLFWSFLVCALVARSVK